MTFSKKIMARFSESIRITWLNTPAV